MTATDQANQAFFASLFGSAANGVDPTDVAAFRGAVQKNDMLASLAPAVMGAKFNTSTWSPGTTLGVTALQSFLGAALGEYARQKEAVQLEKVANVLPQLYADPLNTQAPAGVDPEAFAGLKISTIAKLEDKKAAANAAAASAIADVFKSGLVERAKAVGGIQGQNEAYGVTGAQNPNSPQAKEADAARAEISKLPAVQQLQLSQSMLSRVSQFKDLDTQTSDIPFITLFVQSLDGSTVRDGEYQRVEGTNPLLQRFKNLFEARLNGGSSLGTDVKNQIYNELLNSQKSLFQEAMSQAAPRLSTALQRGARQEDALPFNPHLYDAPKNQPAAPTAAVAGAGVSPEQMAAINQAKTEILVQHPNYTPAELAAALRARFSAKPATMSAGSGQGW